jgi:hypothetical protein
LTNTNPILTGFSPIIQSFVIVFKMIAKRA